MSHFKIVQTDNNGSDATDLTGALTLKGARGQLSRFFKIESKGFDGDPPYFIFEGTTINHYVPKGHRYTLEDHRKEGYFIGNITPETGGGWFRMDIVPCDASGKTLAAHGERSAPFAT